jgi:hypothetical protein
LTRAVPADRRDARLIGLGGLLFACGVGLALRAWHLTAASLFTDEAFTFAISDRPVPRLVHDVTVHDFHPPLFYLVTHAALAALRWMPWDYRYLILPCGLVTIAGTWACARFLFGVTAAAIAALLVALSPALVTYDRMYRMYAPLVSLSVVSWWLLLGAQHAGAGRRRWWWAGYTGAILLLAYTHYLGLLVIATQAAYVLVRRREVAALFAYGLLALAFAPWVPHLVQQLPGGGMVLSRPGLNAGLAQSIREAFALGIPAGPLPIALALWLPAAVVAALAAGGTWLGRGSALPWWLACLPLAVGLSIVMHRNLAYFPRYLLIDIPPLAIASGLVVHRALETRVRPAGVFGLCALCAACATGCRNVLFDPYYQFPDWYAVNAVILHAERPHDAIILDAGYELPVVRDFTAFRGHTILSFMNPSDFAPIECWLAAHPAQRVWYVEHQSFYWDPQRRIEASLERRPRLLAVRFPRALPVNAVRVELFGAVPAPRRR